MNNKKGFTLIELLAVIAILTVIMVIITPKVFKQLKHAETVIDKEQLSAIIDASKLYMNQHSELLPQENDIYLLQFQQLKDSGLIKTNQILNPSTKEELTGCVLVKYENNKYQYEYKENICNNEKITVTFDPDGGQLEQTTKKVIYHNNYGELPTPTKEGYTFIGWNGKNLMPIINRQNYNVGHYADRTTSEFKNENGINYIRINGNPSTTNIDTSWFIYNANKITLSNGIYNLSFDIRSKNSIATQYIKKAAANSGNTKISVNDTSTKNMIGNIDKDYTFANDGEWHHIAAPITLETSTNDAIVTIGNDIPNIYGTDSYLDVANIQLELGTTATEYEPYYITSDTKVVQQSNHTLKAIWQANS